MSRRAFSLLFIGCMLFSIFALASCGKKGAVDTTATGTEPVGTKPETTEANTTAAETTAVPSVTEAPVDEGPRVDEFPVADAPFDPADGMTENMLARSVHYEGDVTRLKAKLDQIYDESYAGETKIFFLGDSITEGSGSLSGPNSFRRRTEAWFNENGKSRIVCKSAGIGATDTYLAVHRVERDVLSMDPDIIFIEFINDSDDEFYTACMESLIRKCLAAPTNPAVVLIEMTLKGGGNCQTAHATAARAYGVPVLSYHDAVTPEIEAGNFPFSDISADGTHPNPIGHGWVAEIIAHFLEQVSASPAAGEVTPFDPATPSIMGDKYANAGLYEKNSAGLVARPDGNFIRQTTPKKFQNGWATDNGGTITFEAEFANFGLLYYKTTDGKTGIVNVKIDGVNLGFVNGNFPDGWGDYPAAVELYTSNESKMHTVTITVSSAARKQFEILGLLMS